MKHIVVLGGSYAGITTAHRILKHVDRLGSFKVTVVAPNSEFYWNMASPRAIIPGQFSDDQLFEPIAAGFAQYPADQFEFVLASAEKLNVEAQKVMITGADGERTLDYDYLIVATGSRTRTNSPFKTLDSTEETKKVLHSYQESVQKAKTIVVAGAGVTGVEIAGELGAQYGHQKDIILLTNASTILPTTPANVTKYATQALQSLGVTIRYHTTVVNTSSLLDGNEQTLHFSNGETLITNMYISAFGLLPNSSFVPSKHLNADGFVTVDPYLKLKGSTNIWALGDVCDVEGMQALSCDRQSVYVSKSLVALLSGKNTMPYKPMTSRMMGLQIGKKDGVGHFGTWKIPTFIVVKLRKTLFVERLGPMLNGKLA